MNFANNRQHSVKRILIVSGNYPPHIVGGGEISTKIMAESFASDGAAVRVVTCADTESIRTDNGVTIDTVRSPNIYWRLSPSIDWRFMPPWRSQLKRVTWHILDNYNPRSRRVLMKKMQEFKPDIVVTGILENFGTSAWLAAKRLNIPVVNIIHGYYLQCITASRFRNYRHCETRCMRCRLATAGKKFNSKYVDGVIGVSRYVLNAHVSEGYFSNARQICIYNPVEHRVEQPRTAPKAKRLTFGFLGKMHSIKGIEELIRGFSSGRVNGRLIVAGDGDRSFEARLRAIADPAFVEFIGWVDPMVLFNQIDYLIYPSVLNEPFGRGTIEAMSQGIPVLGARRGGIPEVIEHGRNGFLYDPMIAGDLETAVESARAADYAELSRNALTTSKSYSKTVIMKQYTDFLNTVVSEHGCTKNMAAPSVATSV